MPQSISIKKNFYQAVIKLSSLFILGLKLCAMVILKAEGHHEKIIIKYAPMFGLEDISNWQFTTGILLCLAGYYLIITFYLLLKKDDEQKETSFEAEAYQAHHVVRPKVIKASDYPSVPARHELSDEDSLLVTMSREPDFSGYVLEALQGTRLEDKDTFLSNIEYELK